MKTNSQSLNRSEILFLVIILACLAVAVWLVLESYSRHGSDGTEQIGTVTFKNKYAERKVSGEVIWDGIIQNGPVYNFDTIRTGAGSSAVIHLNNKIEISLGEESLILLDLGPQETKLNISGGSVIVQAFQGTGSADNNPNPPLVLSTDAGQVTLKSGTLTVNDSQAGVSLSLSNGNAVVTNDSGEQEMAGNAILGTNGKVAPGPALVQISPATGDVILTPLDNARVPFRWRSTGTQTRPVLLTVASDRDFSKVEFQARLGDNQGNVALPPGTHYWRLADPNDPSQSGTVSWFNLQTILPPRLITPLARPFRIAASALGTVDFTWTPSENAVSYRLDIMDRAAPKLAVASRTTGLSSLTVNSLKPGEYTWMVTAFSGPDLIESHSETGSFAIVAGPLQAASVRSPTSGGNVPAGEASIQISTAAIQNGAVVATWEPVEGADRYIATVSRDPGGKDIVETVTTSANFLQLEKALEKGTYFVTVQTIANEDRSPPSTGMQIKITDPQPPELIAPASGTQLDPSMREVRFRWSDPNQGNSYRLLVARDGNFNNVVVDRIIASRETALSLPDNISGNLVWKVSLLEENRKPIVESSPANFTMYRLLESPRVISPVEGAELDVNEVTKIDFAWQRVPDADSYRLVLYRMTAGLKAAVETWNTKEPAVVLDHFEGLSVGSYAWELQAIRGSEGGISALSPVAVSFFWIFQSAPLEAPKITLKAVKSSREGNK